LKKERPGTKKTIPEKVNSVGNSGHPEKDQFVEGKIGSGFMSTIEGQPNLEGSANELNSENPQANIVKPIQEKTPGPVEK